MRYLYIDTSSSYLYTAIVKDNELVAEIKEEFGQSLSEVALPKLASMFKNNSLDTRDINKIIVVNGPGSFTGIRIGITIAKVYAWSLDIPITTITSLEAMAISSKSDKVHVPMINARRGFVFAAAYDKSNKEIIKPQHIKLNELLSKLNEISDYEIITNDEFDSLKETTKYSPDFLKVVSYFKDKEAINPHAVNPDYLKLTEAEESKL